MRALHIILILLLLLILISCTKPDRWAGKVDYGAHGVTGY